MRSAERGGEREEGAEVTLLLFTKKRENLAFLFSLLNEEADVFDFLVTGRPYKL